MSKYKIVATIDGYTNEGRVKLRGTGDYLHKVPDEKEKIFKNIIVTTDEKDLTSKDFLKFLDIDKDSFSIDENLNNPFFQSALGISFANKKPLKFDIEEENDNYKITGISQPNEEE